MVWYKFYSVQTLQRIKRVENHQRQLSYHPEQDTQTALWKGQDLMLSLVTQWRQNAVRSLLTLRIINS